MNQISAHTNSLSTQMLNSLCALNPFVVVRPHSFFNAAYYYTYR